MFLATAAQRRPWLRRLIGASLIPVFVLEFLFGTLVGVLLVSCAVYIASPHLLGTEPCIADFAAYHVVWFYRGRRIDCRAVFDPYPRLLAWRDRMAAIGHGQRTDIDADVALGEARAAQPAPPRPSDPQEGDPLPGQRARVRAADNARDWIEGEVSFIDAGEIALLRTDPEVGEVAVHFPRVGYDWRAA